MRTLLAALVLLASCTMPPSSTSATQSPTALPSATLLVTSSPSASPSPSGALQDLQVVAAGDVRGDHALVLQVNSSSIAGVASKVIIWDVPVDGSTARQLVTYTRGPQAFTDFDILSLSQQLSGDGRHLVLSDPLDVSGNGLVVVDLVAGSTQRIALEGIANQPRWSPNGESIAYRSAALGSPFSRDTGVWVVGASGGAARQVATSDIAAGSGATLVYGWTDPRSILYLQHGLRLVDTSTGNVTRMPGALTGVTIAAREKRPSMAIVFDDGAIQSGSGHVEVRDTISDAGRVVARYGQSEGTFLNEPRWRPGESDEILLFYAFGQGVAQRDELVIVDGVSGTRRTLPTASYVRSAAWTADGRQIMYASLTELRVRNADGSNDRVVFHPAPASGSETAFIAGVAAFAPH